MKKSLLILILLSFSIKGFGQENEIKMQAENDLKRLSNEFELKKKELKIQDSIFKSLTNELSTNPYNSDFEKLKEQQLKTKLFRKKLDSIYTLAVNYFVFYESKGEKKETLVKFFPHKHEINKTTETEENQTQKTFLYFGKNKVIAESDGFFKDKTANLIFNDILETKSESYLGDFIIPQKNQLISLFIRQESGNFKETQIKVKFKEIKIHLYEGSLYDIKLIVFDENNNELLFENKRPISLLRFPSIGSKNYIFFKTASSNNKEKVLEIDDYQNYRIRLSDALLYIPNPGDNYVPEDLTLEFPTKTDGVPDNENNSIKYKVNQDTIGRAHV